MFYDPYVQESIWNKIGDGFKTAGKDIGKGAVIAAPYIIQYGPTAAEIALELAGELVVQEPNVQGFFGGIGNAFKGLGSDIAKGAVISAPYIA